MREVIKIKDEGGTIGSGKRYNLHRGNLALNFGFLCNWDMFVEFPRQHGKTISAACYYLWLFNFGTTNSNFMFINKKFDDSKLNLKRVKEIRENLPPYLRMDQAFGPDGKKIKVADNTMELQHPLNRNKISTMPAAKNKVAANNLGRGLTVPFIWYDEFGFIAHNKIIRSAASPAYSRASQNAANNNKPYGMLITTTPGDLTTEEGKDAYDTKELATPFLEDYYDFGLQKLEELKRANTSSSMFYIRYTYQQLGSGQEYFANMVKALQKDWVAIRREVLLEWATISSNSPFKPEDLEIVKQYIHEPKRTIMLGGLYPMHIYEELSPYNPPIMGCDVSSGYYKDSSTIVLIDSTTTKVCGVFNCNYISPVAFADVIYELVVKYLPNAVVNIERNNVGAAVLGRLKNTKIKHNLYYEIKDRVLEERFDGIHTVRNKQKVKVYGLDNSKTVRDLLMDLLRERMEYHKDKFISPIIYHEMEGLEVKKNGRIDHGDTGHDDTVFGYLMALYVWYYGKDLMSTWGVKKSTIRSDEDYEESLLDKEESMTEDILTDSTEVINDDVHEQINMIMRGHGQTSEEFLIQQAQKDRELLEQLLSNNQLAREAYSNKYNDKSVMMQTGFTKIPDSVFLGFVNDDGSPLDKLNKEFASMGDMR